MACPWEFICPLTGAKMNDPVLAADGCVYERVAILAWFSRSKFSPSTWKPLTTTDVHPHHEKKREIQAWTKGTAPPDPVKIEASVPQSAPPPPAWLVEHSLKQIRERLGKLIWATSANQVSSDLEQLGGFVRGLSIRVPRFDFERLVRCLRADPQLWSEDVERSLARLETDAVAPAETEQPVGGSPAVSCTSDVVARESEAKRAPKAAQRRGDECSQDSVEQALEGSPQDLTVDWEVMGHDVDSVHAGTKRGAEDELCEDEPHAKAAKLMAAEFTQIKAELFADEALLMD